MESWKIIEGFENYMVSDHGNVKNKKTGRILKSRLDKYGYSRINVSGDGITRTKSIHQLVARAFIENTEDKKCIDHINNDKLNNNISNLRWATHTENAQNASISVHNKSGCKGVIWHKVARKWQVQIQVDGLKIHLGSFTNLEDAKQARITRANEAFGVFTNSCEKII